MSFDWTSFATGFMEKTDEIWTGRKEKAEDYEERQREAAERNIATISRRRQIADQVTGYAASLKQNGLSDDQIQAIVSSGPDAISKAMAQVTKAVEANGGRPLGPADVDTILNLPDNFTPIDMSTDEFIRKTYGLSVPTRTEQQTEESSFFDRLTGRSAMADARGRLASEPMAAGMSVQEINDAARSADYQTLIPGSFVTYSGLEVFNPAKDADAFIRSTNLQVKAAQETTAYTDLEKAAESVRFDTSLSDVERNSELTRIRREQQEIIREVVGPLIDSYSDMYGDSFTQPMERYVSSILGADYLAGTQEPTRQGTPAVDDLEAATPDLAEPVVPEVDVTPTGLDLNDLEPGMRITPEMLPMLPDDVEGGTLTQEMIDSMKGEVEATTITPEGPVEEVVVNTPEELEEPAPDAAVRNKEGELVTFIEWQDMSRSERIDAGLPTSVIGGNMLFNRFLVGAGLADYDTGERIPFLEAASNWFRVDTPDGEARGIPEPVEQSPVYKELSSQGVDDLSIALLESDGGDLLNYLRDQGVTSEEEMAIALGKWGQENGKTMPFDKAALIQALRPHVLK